MSPQGETSIQPDILAWGKLNDCKIKNKTRILQIIQANSDLITLQKALALQGGFALNIGEGHESIMLNLGMVLVFWSPLLHIHLWTMCG